MPTNLLINSFLIKIVYHQIQTTHTWEYFLSKHLQRLYEYINTGIISVKKHITVELDIVHREAHASNNYWDKLKPDLK